ncbi:MAG TPA: DEAD/DEAH box helicase family protein [Mycobacteriales bacterium]|nr:DEAD/DEAH box helicase family protein [Mycobacteriales bacterium]
MTAERSDARVEAPRPSVRLRAWQAEALARYRATTPNDFLVTATPGAGKTAFALALAGELLSKRVIDRVIVVAPTDHLRTQWAYAADRLGVRLDPTLANDAGPVRADVHGYVTTYAQVASRPAIHEARTRAKRSLVILDEIHHAGDGLSWGEATMTAFDTASKRLALTGTPFRTRAEERIPFVRYETDSDGALASMADYTYGYGEALAEGVVRPVVFAAYTGVSRWKNSAGDVIAASLSENGTKSVETRAWRTALNPSGKWIPHVIAAMDERITHLRATNMPDAAGLVLASDQDDAREYAEIVKRITGHKPALILSDDPKASKRLERFTHSDERFAVCVRMISEGVDIPRAACLAWMTSYRTPLFFAQAVGRVVRSRRPGESATVFLPAVRPLLALAAEIEQARNSVMPPRSTDGDAHDLDPLIADEDRIGLGDTWEALDSDAEFAHVLEGGRAVVPTYVAHTDEDQDFLGLPGLLSAEQTAGLLARRDEAHRRRATQDDSFGRPRDTAWQSAAGLRKEINEMVRQLAARQKVTPAVVHGQVRKAVPGPASATATEEVLAARRDWLMEQVL